MIDKLIAQCLAEEPQALTLIGQRSLTKTEINQAISLLKKYTSGNPEYSNALYLLGLIKFKKKQYSQAINYVESAIAMGNSWAMNLRAYMHDKGLGGTRDSSNAIQLYEQSSALGNSGALNGLAYMYYENKDYNKAILFYQKAIKLENSLAMINLAQMYELGEGEDINYNKAIELYDKAIALGNGLAMGRRARMHKEGIGGPQNILESTRLFYQAYDKTQHEEYLGELKDLPLERLEAQLYLILAYLHNNHLKPEAQKIFLANSINLAPLLVNELTLLLNGLAPQPHLIQNLRSLLLLEEDAVTFLNIWPYVQFKLHLFDGNREKAYQLFVEYPQILNEFIASDWNELGKQVVTDSLYDSMPESKLCYSHKACNFFYQASRINRDNDFYHTLFLNHLKEKEALEASLKTTFINRSEEVSSASEPQAPPFTEREIIPLNYTKEIETLSRYLKSNQSKSDLSEQQLVYFLIRRLSYNFPLEASLHLPHIRKQLSRAELLYYTLKNLLPADSTALKPLLTDEACKALLETTNCGQQVYEALQNNALSGDNLKFLVKAQDKVCTFLKNASDKDKVEEVVNALFKQSKNNDPIKTKSYRHNSPHTLFRPFKEMLYPINHTPKQTKR